MPTIQIPAAMRKLTGGQSQVDATGSTLREAIEDLEQRYPGIHARLVDGARLRPGLALFVNDAMRTTGLRTRLNSEDRVYFAPAIAGGSA